LSLWILDSDPRDRRLVELDYKRSSLRGFLPALFPEMRTGLAQIGAWRMRDHQIPAVV
jgi:hypothetical protein